MGAAALRGGQELGQLEQLHLVRSQRFGSDEAAGRRQRRQIRRALLPRAACLAQQAQRPVRSGGGVDAKVQRQAQRHRHD